MELKTRSIISSQNALSELPKIQHKLKEDSTNSITKSFDYGCSESVPVYDINAQLNDYISLQRRGTLRSKQAQNHPVASPYDKIHPIFKTLGKKTETRINIKNKGRNQLPAVSTSNTIDAAEEFDFIKRRKHLYLVPTFSKRRLRSINLK